MQALGRLPVFAHIGGDPDDVAVSADGQVWVSDHGGGRLLAYDRNGALIAAYTDAQGPEGIAPLPDGAVLVAQQATDRIDLFDPRTGRDTTWLQLQPRAGVEGVDGIALSGTVVLVPDSARGRLLAVPVGPRDAAGNPTVLAGDLGRPVSAAPAGGDYVVALENAPGLVTVPAGGGAATPLGAFTSLDDLVVVRGLVYATDLAAGSVVVVDPATRAVRTLVTASPSPQGLAYDGTSLLVVDSTVRAAVRLPLCA